VNRMAELVARRRALLARCEAQRIELAQSLAALRGEPHGAGAFAGDAARRARHPLAWVAALAGLTALGRTRDVLTLLVWIRSALSVAARAAQVLGIISQLRTRRSAGARVRTARAGR
jgi:hypothetical protein